MTQRIQRRRTKGWRMPEGAVYVGRGSKWDNPYMARQCCSVTFYVRNLYDPALWTVFSRLSGDGVGPAFRSRREAVIEAMRRFRKYAERCDLAPLRGKDLACWCRLDQPCHADVLLELANKGAE